MIRREDWPVRLADFLAARLHMPFEWGRKDCVLFALDAAFEMTGLDAAQDIRGTYTTAIGAARRMKALYGHAGLAEASTAFAARWNGEEISPSMARRGDLVLYRNEGLVSLGVCVGRHFAGAGVNGSVSVPMRLAERAWRV